MTKAMTSHVTPDGVLLRRVVDGDAAALTALRRRHALSLYALAYGIVMDSAEADAVVLETFQEAWLRASRLEWRNTSVYGWLAAMTRSRATALVRSREWPARPTVQQSQQSRHVGGTMLAKVIGTALALALPCVLAAQRPAIPNEHASDTAKSKVAAHAHPPATHYRGSIEHPVPPAQGATPAVPATPATPATKAPGSPATPATPAQPATPAVPPGQSHKPSDPGGGHRP